jgi:nitroreductase
LSSAPTESSSPSWPGLAQRRPRGSLGGNGRPDRPNPEDARSRDLIQYDLGQATMSIMLAAADLGIGSAHSAVSDQELARRLLGFPEDRFCAWLISLGTPADRPLRPIARPNRRPFEDVVHRGHW